MCKQILPRRRLWCLDVATQEKQHRVAPEAALSPRASSDTFLSHPWCDFEAVTAQQESFCPQGLLVVPVTYSRSSQALHLINSCNVINVSKMFLLFSQCYSSRRKTKEQQKQHSLAFPPYFFFLNISVSLSSLQDSLLYSFLFVLSKLNCPST